MKKRLLSLLLCAAMLANSLPLSVWATDPNLSDEQDPVSEISVDEPLEASIVSGEYGDFTWTLSNDGILMISGKGEIEGTGSKPWGDYQYQITKLILQEGVLSIGDYAFAYLPYLSELTLPDTLVSIGEYAFDSCPLNSVTIPKSVTDIGRQAFSTLLGDFTVVEDNQYFSSEDGVLFNKDKTLLIQYPSHGKSDDSYSIPVSVKEIASCAFMYADFSNIEIPNGIQRIGVSAFFNCLSLQKVDIPASVQSIGGDAFSWCQNIQSFNVSENNPYYSSDEHGVLFDGTKETLINFPAGAQLVNYTVPNCVKNIEEYAFHNSGLFSIILPNNIVTIEEYAFSNCNNLQSVEFSGPITQLSHGAFAWNSALSRVAVPSGVSIIEHQTFQDCEALTAVEIPTTVTEIEYRAFEGCTSLQDIYYPGTEEQWGQINIVSEDNEPLLSATVHYNSTMPEDDEAIVTGVSLNTASHSMKPGETLTLTATISPETAVNKNVTWSSNNEAVATVKDGIVTAIAVGEAVITVTTEDGGFTATCNVTVATEEIKVTGVSLNAASHTMKVGEIFTLTATVTPEEATNKNVSWVSSNPSVATVADGVVKAVSAGNAVITVTTEDSGFKTTCAVTVEEVQLSNKCGDNATWSLDEDGVLRIDGFGAMYNYDNYDAPWNDKIKDITTIIIGRDITYIGNNAFAGTPTYAGCPNLTELYIVSESAAIGARAFSYCTKLETVYLQQSYLSLVKENAYDGCDALSAVYFEHSEKEWVNWTDVIIEKGNESLTSATVYTNGSSIESLAIKYWDDLDEQEKTAKVKWGYPLFTEDARNIANSKPKYFAELVKISALLSKNTYSLSDDGFLKGTLEELGAKDIEIMNNGEWDISYPAHSISHVEFNQDGEKHDIVIVTVQGTQTKGDTITDIKAWAENSGDSPKEHPGFSDAKDTIKDEIKAYLLKNGIDASDSKILITGHSYGAAVANLLANSLKDIFDQSNIYAYTFASPNNIVVNSTSHVVIRSNIHNFRNVWDPVVHIPVALDSREYYTVFGRQHFFTLEEIGDDSEGTNIAGNHNCTHYVNYAFNLVDHQSINSLPTRCVQIHCPVDVTAYDKNGNIVGRIIDNQLDESSTSIMMYPVSDRKNIFVNQGEDVQLSIVATDAGTMDVIITEYDIVTGNVSAVKKYSDVGLKKDKVFGTNVSEETLTKDIELIVVDQEGNRLAVVKEDGTEIDISSKEDADTTNPDVDDDDSVDKPSYVYDEDESEEDYLDTVLKKIKVAKSGDTIKVNVGSKNRIPVELINALKKKDNVTLVIRRNKGDNITLTFEITFKDTKLGYYLISYLETVDDVIVSSSTVEKENPETGAF